MENPALTAQAVKQTPLADLLRAQEHLEEVTRANKSVLETVRAELASRVGADLDGAVDEASKQHGTFHFTHDNIALTAEIDKEVKWDSAKLLAVCGAMPWEHVVKIFKIEVSVPERVYAVLPASMSITPEQEALFKQIELARSVIYGKPKIKARKPA